MNTNLKNEVNNLIDFIKKSISNGIVVTAKNEPKNAGILFCILLVLFILPFMFGGGGGGSSDTSKDPSQYSSDANTPASELNTDPSVRGKFSEDLKFPYGQFILIDHTFDRYYFLGKNKIDVWTNEIKTNTDEKIKFYDAREKDYKRKKPSSAVLRGFKKGEIIDAALIIYKGSWSGEDQELVLIKAVKDGEYSYWAIEVWGKHRTLTQVLYQ